MQEKKLLAFYGSLRTGMYNHKYFEKNLNTLESGVTITGFKLFSLGAYPCVVKTNDVNDTIVVDLFEADQEGSRRIDNMEKGAGYDLEEIEINGKNFGIYTFEQSSLARLSERQVPGGDWVKFLQINNEKSKL